VVDVGVAVAPTVVDGDVPQAERRMTDKSVNVTMIGIEINLQWNKCFGVIEDFFIRCISPLLSNTLLYIISQYGPHTAVDKLQEGEGA